MEEAIQTAISQGRLLQGSNIELGDEGTGPVVGKVRDTYSWQGDKLVLVTTDRQSAFDRVIAQIPFKGQVLNRVSEWWFERTRSIVGNALLAVPHANVSVMKNCTVFPVEFVVRGYITGSTR